MFDSPQDLNTFWGIFEEKVEVCKSIELTVLTSQTLTSNHKQSWTNFYQ